MLLYPSYTFCVWKSSFFDNPIIVFKRFWLPKVDPPPFRVRKFSYIQLFYKRECYMYFMLWRNVTCLHVIYEHTVQWPYVRLYKWWRLESIKRSLLIAFPSTFYYTCYERYEQLNIIYSKYLPQHNVSYLMIQLLVWLDIFQSWWGGMRDTSQKNSGKMNNAIESYSKCGGWPPIRVASSTKSLGYKPLKESMISCQPCKIKDQKCEK